MLSQKSFIFISIFAFLILSIYVGLYLFQYKLLFYPTVLDANHKFKFNGPFEEKTITYGNNQSISALLFKPTAAKSRILYFHGNGQALDSWGFVAEELAQKYNSEILIIDYPGYGKSSGGVAKSEAQLLDSAQAAFDFFKVTTNDKLPIIIYGRSLGSGIASYIASKNLVQGLVLETPYVSIKKMARIYIPIIPEFIVNYNLDNLVSLKDLKTPIIILHGTSDEVIPYNQSQQLAQEYPKLEFVTIETAGHNNLAEFSLYWKSMDKFLEMVTR
ncbi:MAG: alpha/beta fold hydrolase [Pseudobdellovibrio sp.]